MAVPRIHLVRPHARRHLLYPERPTAEHPRFERAALDCVQCHVAATPRAECRASCCAPCSPAPRNTGRRDAILYHRPGQRSEGSLGRMVRHRLAREADHIWVMRAAQRGAPGATGRSPRQSSGPHGSARHLGLSHALQRHRRAPGAGPSDADAQPDHADQLSDQAGAICAGKDADRCPMPPGSNSSGRPNSWCAICSSPTKRRWKSPSRARRDSPRSSRRAVRATARTFLRDFDLQRRIFKYPCSYLIYSEAFDAIPAAGQGLCVPANIRSAERPRTRPRVRVSLGGGSPRDPRNSGGHQARRAGRVEGIRKTSGPCAGPDRHQPNRSERKLTYENSRN
jgi:hypothetical protein